MNKIIDLHCDIYSHLALATEQKESDIFKRYHYDNFKKGNIYLSVFNLWLDVEPKDAKKRAKQMLELGAKDLVNNKLLNIVRNYDDIKDNGKINYLIGLEGLDYLDSAQELYYYYQYGVRLISLTWNYSNNFGVAITDNNEGGLTNEGREAIRIMNELGIVIDISHLNDAGALEILKLSNKPVIASHSNVRNICNHPRNLPDNIIKEIAKKDGVIGINAFHVFISDERANKNINGLIKHIDYLKELVGIDYIAFGFDFMDFLDDDATSAIDEAEESLADLKNQAELSNLVAALKNHGYSDEELAKITHLNALRVFKEVLG